MSKTTAALLARIGMVRAASTSAVCDIVAAKAQGREEVWLSWSARIDPVAGFEASWIRTAARRAESLRSKTERGYAMTEIEITNDIEVFDAMRFDVVSGDMVWTGRVGTREAIRREKLAIDEGSWKHCPHQWLDERGFVDRELSRRHPHSWPPTF